MGGAHSLCTPTCVSSAYIAYTMLPMLMCHSSYPEGCCKTVWQYWQLFTLQDHCWSYILRNWHLLQRTPTYKSIPVDQRQRLASDIKQSLSEITTRDSPGDQSQSMGFSVLWDASNTQPGAAADNALTPDGKRPVSKATEKRRLRLAEEQERQRQEEEKRMLQQRRQQTVREIRQRQAAAAEAADRAVPSSAVQSAAGLGPSNRAVPGQRQAGVGQGAAHGQQPVQARAGQRHHSTLQARAALPSAGPSRKLAPQATATSAVSAQSSQQRLPAARRLSLRTSSNSSTPVQTAQTPQRSNRPNARVCSESSSEHDSRHPRSASASAQQQRPAAASPVPSSHLLSTRHSTVGPPQSVGPRSRPVSEADLPGAGRQQRQQSLVVAAQTAGRISAGHAQTASPANQKL